MVDKRYYHIFLVITTVLGFLAAFLVHMHEVRISIVALPTALFAALALYYAPRAERRLDIPVWILVLAILLTSSFLDIFCR